MKKRIRKLSTVLLIMVLGLPVGIAWAHGGGVPRMTNVDAGPYWVSAWTQPDPLREGQAHITVAVSEPMKSTDGRREAGSPVLNALVQVQFRPLDREGETLLVLATHEAAANKLFYEADLELPETGRWQVIVQVEGPQGSGSASFEAQVSPPTGVSVTWLVGLGLAGLVTMAVVQRFRNQKSGE